MDQAFAFWLSVLRDKSIEIKIKYLWNYHRFRQWSAWDSQEEIKTERFMDLNERKKVVGTNGYFELNELSE